MSREHDLYKEVLGDMMPDFERARINAKRGPQPAKTAGRSPRGRRRLAGICVAAAAVAAAGIGFAAPPVRAFVTKIFWGGTAAEYVSAPESARPVVENVAVQTVEPRDWRVRAFSDSELDWADQITGFEIEEALYDAGELTLKYAVEGSVSEIESGHATDGSSVARLAYDGELEGPVKCIIQADVVTGGQAAPLEECAEMSTRIAPEEAMAPDESTIVEKTDDRITMTSSFHLGDRDVSGELSLFLSCGMAIPTGDGGVSYERQGLLEAPFRIDDAGDQSKNAAPGTHMLSGHAIEIKEAALSPTGLRILYEAPNDAFREETGDVGSWDFQVYADGELLTAGEGDARISFLDYLMGIEDGVTEGRVTVPFPDMSISQIELKPCDSSGRLLSEDSIILDFE